MFCELSTQLTFVKFYFLDFRVFFLFFCSSLFLSFFLFVSSFGVGFVLPILDLEKTSIFECGFSSFSDIRKTLNIKFYKVSLLFIILDLEVVFILPWVLTFNFCSSILKLSGFVFFCLLILGLLLEYFENVINW